MIIGNYEIKVDVQCHFQTHVTITKLTRKELVQKKARKLARKIMIEGYRYGTHHLEALMGGIKEELQAEFREDNLPTTVCFMVDSILQSSGLKEDSPLYTKLKEIVK
jgi:FKBP-type peptidyl-prolyl cis-trans isomerase (trigger factor)